MNSPKPLFIEDGSGVEDLYPPKPVLSYPELCAAFLAELDRTARGAALYQLAHPIVMESLKKAADSLTAVFNASKEEELTLSFANDAWLFNGAPVPAASREAEHLHALFKGRNIQGLTFVRGALSFEIGALCEYAGGQQKAHDPGLKEFLASRGVTNIRPEAARYVREGPRAAPTGPHSPWPRRPGPAIETAAPRPAAPEAAPRAPEPAPRPPAPPKESRPGPGPAPEPRRNPVPPAAPAAAPEHETPLRRAAAVPRPAGEKPGGKGAGGEGPGQGAGPGFGTLLTRLVETVVKDPAERVGVYEEAIKMIKESMEKQLSAATRSLAEEKEKAVNSQNRTQNVLSSVAEGKVIVDKEGKVLMMNPAAEEIAGKRFKDVAGRHISEHLKPGEHFLTISKDMEIIPGRPLSGGVEKSGDEHVERAVRRSLALLEDDEGRVVGAYTTLPELTKFKEAQKMQEEFLSRVTHDLQSPLSSITSALEMLEQSAAAKLDGDENKFLSISVRNSQRLTQMIRGILDFSKLQSGKMPVHPEPASVSAMINEAIEGLLPWARTKGVSLAAKLPAPDITAMADHQRIVQVLTNLISNAIKATPPGGSVTVAASVSANIPGSVVIGVRDTGKGIAREDLARVFEKFVQLESGEPREGVGLGLSIVSEFVRLHGGRVWAASEAGKGATFYFTLPVSQTEPFDPGAVFGPDNAEAGL